MLIKCHYRSVQEGNGDCKKIGKALKNMKTFMVRMLNALAVVGLLAGYNTVIDARAKDEQIAQLNAQLESALLAGENMGSNRKTADGNDAQNDHMTGSSYMDGIYDGTAEGFGGPITVNVTVSDGNISEINIVSADHEDGAYLTMAQDIIPVILEKQSADVDTVSGATFSSTGIRDAVRQALEKAEQ